MPIASAAAMVTCLLQLEEVFQVSHFRVVLLHFLAGPHETYPLFHRLNRRGANTGISWVMDSKQLEKREQRNACRPRSVLTRQLRV